jgi:hypothetical protein
MAKIPLTIDPAYCSSWRFFEGIREFIQNAKDAEEYDNLAMSLEHKPRSSTLVIATKNICIEASTLLLLGKTSKGDGHQRGKFGEGFALGCLALVRAGHPVTIYNGHEVWRPEISKPDEGVFAGNDLLIMTTRKLQGYRPDFTVEIENVSKDVWEATRKMFLFLAPPNADTLVKVSEGTVIMDPGYQGLIYSRGIYVMRNEELEFGYDLVNAELDRDRRMIEEWNLKYKLGQVWEEALRADPAKTAPRVYQMAKDDKPEVKSLHYRVDAKLVKSLRDEFEKEHGMDTVPVSTISEARELDGLGAKTAMVTGTLQQLLAKSGPQLSDVKEKLRGKVKKRYGYHDLTKAESDVCAELVEIITLDYAIVDFNDTTACRQDGDGSTLLLARDLLAQEPKEILLLVGSLEAKRIGVALELLLIKHIAKKWGEGHAATPTSTTASATA